MESHIPVPVYTKTFEVHTFGRSPMNIEKKNIETEIKRKIPSAKRVKLIPQPNDSEYAKTWYLRSSHQAEIENKGFAICDSEYTLDKVIERLGTLETKVETLETKIEKLQYFQDQMTIREVLCVAKNKLIDFIGESNPTVKDLIEIKHQNNWKIIQSLIKYIEINNSEFSPVAMRLIINKPYIDHLNRAAHSIPYEKNTKEYKDFLERAKNIFTRYINNLDKPTLETLKKEICFKRELASKKEAIDEFYNGFANICDSIIRLN